MHACKCEIGGTLPPPALATLAKALETGEPQRLEVACGELVYSMLFAPIAGANYVNLYGRDITYRKLAEARLRRQALVFENMYDGVLLTDAQGLITELNPAAERMFGYAREELIGKSPEILNRTEEAAALTESILRGIEQDDRWSGEITFVRKDGTTGVCEASLVPLHNEEGVRIGTITVNRDLTASKEASQAKAELQEQLRQAQKMEALGTLASGITHDFENLLTAISGYTELAKGALPEGHAAAEALEKVEETAQQARSVTNALLAFSHRAVIPKKTVNLSATLDRAAHLLRRLLPPAIEIVDDLDRRKDLWIRGDAGQLQRILMNLAFNARDAMPDGGKLRFSLRDTGSSSEAAARPGGSRETRRAVLIVEDTGCGMSPEVRERIFEPFWTTKPRGVGTGLGLSLTLACVQDLGGEIVVRSEPGEGTRVTITLPTCEPPAEAESKKPAREPDRRPKRLVLVIERNQHIRSIITSTLRSRGYDVAAASTPTDAVAVLRRRSDAVRLMIIDFDLLDGSGMHPLKQACPP
ncbi:MAG: ATP-binding protein, partial [Phycisphaerae bacterium]